MPGMLAIMSLSCAAVARRESTTPWSLSSCASGDGALEFAHPVVERVEVVIGLVVAIAPCLVDEEEAVASMLRVVGDDQASLPSGNVLSLLHRKATDVSDRPDLATLVFCEESLGAVFDHMRSCSRASSMISSISHGMPNRCVTIIPLVRGVIRSAIVSAVTL